MKDFEKGCYFIERAANGDVTLQLDLNYISPENLLMAALEFLYEHPDYYLGTWIEHPELKNVLYSVYHSGGRAPLRFYSKDNIATHSAIEGYVYLDHAKLQHVLVTMAQAARDLAQTSARGD